VKAFRTVFGILMIPAVPIGRYWSEYHNGYHCGPYLDLTGLFWILGAPIVAGILAGSLVPLKGSLLRVGTGLGVCVISGFLALFALPPGAQIYSHGFERAVAKEVDIGKLQQWVESTLKRYREGTLLFDGQASYWSPGSLRIASSELPDMMRSGVFSSSHGEPEISVCTNSYVTGGGICITVSWYLHGLVLGDSKFRTDWNPWYSHQLVPGVYSYHGVK
jgi:hypothetical protein